jgi:membrane protease YdiL (CAAX protease family)
VALPKGRPLPLSGSDLLLLLILSLLTVRVLIPLLGLLFGAGANPLLVSMLAIIVQSLVLSGFVLWFVVRRRGVSWAELGFVPLPSGWIPKAILLAILALPLVGLMNVAVQFMVGEPLENPQLKALAPLGFSWFAMLSMLFLAAVVVPVVEEIVFRGVFYAWLRDRLAIAPALAINAVVFAAVHGIPALIPALAVVGVLLAWAYERSGSIWASIVLHGAFNGIMTIGLYLALAQGLEI